MTNPLIFISGSKLPNQRKSELDRFRQICECIGKELARNNFGIVGCPPHRERVLASQLAKSGLHSIDPNAPFSAEGIPTNQLYAKDRIKFVKVANAAIFIGGSSGTEKEFNLCISNQVRPLIPVAGAGGTGEMLSKHLLKKPEDFWDYKLNSKVISVLASTNEDPESYARAVVEVLDKIKRKRWRFWKRLINKQRKQQSAIK